MKYSIFALESKKKKERERNIYHLNSGEFDQTKFHSKLHQYEPPCIDLRSACFFKYFIQHNKSHFLK